MTQLIRHPECMDRDTLYELRATLALHPYSQTARLLLLQNLYLLHDQDFNEELQRAAVYITDRRTIFNMIEAAHYQLRQLAEAPAQTASTDANRTVSLIDTFLDSIPVDDEPDKTRKPTPADAAVDYVAYLLATEAGNPAEDTPQMKGQDLIDTFLEQEKGRLLLTPLPMPDINEPAADDSEANAVNKAADTTSDEENEEEYFTETLARIYIKQGRYQKALDIIGRLSSLHPQKNAYYADQMRFLEKLIINNNKKQK